MVRLTIAVMLFAVSAAAGQGDSSEAARTGDLARVEALLEEGVAVDAATQYGTTPLFFAATGGHIAIVQALVERGADVNAADSFYGMTVLRRALANQQLEIASYLLEHGATDGDRALVVAARRGDRALLDGATGEIRWYYQHLNDHWDLDHPFERMLVDTAVAPDPDAVAWINPRLQPGEMRKVVTGIPGKTGVVYTLDRETGEFLWATPTIAQNVISDIDGATGAVTPNGEVVFTRIGQEVLSCPGWGGGKNWPAGAYSPVTNTMFIPTGCCRRFYSWHRL